LELQAELKLRQKQEADRKQREEMELFNLEEEKKNRKVYESTTYQQQHVWPPSNSSTPAPTQHQPRTIPIIKTDSETELNATKFRFEPLDDDQKRFMAGIRPPSVCYSPPTEEKPFPSIPYYQQHLAFYEAQPDHCGVFDPRANHGHNRSRSPAFGPPPNPLLAFVNKTRDPELDESGIYLCGERLLSPVWYDKHHKKIPPAVQRRIHPHGSPSRPPSKPDLEAIKEGIKKHKQESGSKPPPPPPPMPKNNYSAKGVEKKDSDLPPKGIVADQIRRLSGDASMFALRSSYPSCENSDVRQNMTTVTQTTRHNDLTTIASTSSSSSSFYSNRLNVNIDNCHHNHQASIASASFENLKKNPKKNMNQNSVDNVRVSTGSVGTPGALPKHGRTFTTSGPQRGQGILTQPGTGRIPICGACATQVR
jgi:hypothetical protein